ncbi:MAG: hypothetical protein IPH04_06420 [Saprospirales bacterium]|nr:hypothetical protein [Saprospirales bacterium]MBK6902438.1 hypothetical protein [Saprospirales bacterium]MBK7335790.1 hypothetical protein [Saprospirales bacterium]
MRALLLYPFPLLCAVLFLLHQISQKGLGMSIPLADNYLDTLLCMPLLLTGFQAEQARFWGKRRFGPFEIFCITAFLSFVFEWVFPRLSPRFTADWLDVAAYFAGAMAWYVATASWQSHLE